MHSTDNESLAKLLNYIEKNCPVFYPSILATRKQFPITFQRIGGLLAQWAEFSLGDGFEKVLGDGYVYLTIEVNSAQNTYEKTGRYPNTSFEDVYKVAYSNAEFMTKYHWGLYVANFAWAHHLKILEAFEQQFLPLLNPNDKLLDLGAGSGMWSILCARAQSGMRVQGVDISPTSVERANNLAIHLGLTSVTYALGDAQEYNNPEYDVAISSFLLEHLEEPKRLLQSLHHNLKPGGYGWITTALTAAEIDHITEFRKESEVTRFCEQEGFRVVYSLSTNPPPRKKKRFLPRSMAMIVQKRLNDIW